LLSTQSGNFWIQARTRPKKLTVGHLVKK